jgi:hypothetical protein
MLTIIQGGPKVGLLFHVLDLIYPNHNSKPVFHIPYSHFGNFLQFRFQLLWYVVFGGRPRSPIENLRNGA